MEIVQITLSDLQEAFLLLTYLLFSVAVFTGFCIGFWCHDCISYWFEVFLRFLRRRSYRNKKGA